VSTQKSPARKSKEPRSVMNPSPAIPTVWRLVESAADTGVHNMAVDMALAESARWSGRPALRFYRWWPSCISLGRNQPAAGQYDADEAARRGIEFVRRPTGGRAVFHHREITYSVSVGDRQLGGPRRTYDAIHKALLAGLRLLGATTELVDPGIAMRPSTVPCFQELDGGAIVAGRRKLVGSAQLRERGVLLQHGSILLTADQTPTTELLTVKWKAQQSEPPAALDELLDYLPTWHELVDNLSDGFARLLGIELEPSQLTDEEKELVERYSEHFSDPEWTWRL
jgi:lipoate-protein ligase A